MELAAATDGPPLTRGGLLPKDDEARWIAANIAGAIDAARAGSRVIVTIIRRVSTPRQWIVAVPLNVWAKEPVRPARIAAGR